MTAITAFIGPRRRQALLDELVRGVELGPKLATLALAMIAGAALYGAVLGLWRGGEQVAYAAIKLPLVLILTACLTMLFNWISAVMLGLRIRLAQVAVLTFLALAIAALLLASLVPVVWLFTVSAPPPSLEARTTHNLLYLCHTSFVATAGLAGTAALWRALVGLAGGRRRARKVFVAWVLAFALVGGEVAWALRPFVGSIYYPPAFVRRDALEGNVYEFIWHDIVPYLFADRNGGPR